MSTKFERRNDMDALRAIAMLLGIGFHIGLAYTGTGWLITDKNDNQFFSWLCNASHGFRMPLFFVISGFFTAMLWKKRGLKRLLGHRFKRILLPCVAAVFTIGFAVTWSVEYTLRNAQPDTNAAKYSELTAADNKKLGEKLAVLKDWALVLKSHGGRSLVLKDDYEFLPHGKGSNLVLGETEKAVKVVFDQGVIRKLDNPVKAFEVSYEKFNEENPVTVWYSFGNTERAHKWAGNSDRTLSPLRARHLVLGWDNSLKLVKRGDKRQLVFENLPESSISTSSHLAGDEHITHHEKAGHHGHEASAGLTAAYQNMIRKPAFSEMVFAHMWFLWFLCWLVLIFAVCTFLWRQLKLKFPNRLVAMPWCFLWLIPITYLPQSLMHFGGIHFGPDTSLGLLPFPHTLFYYALFFGFGAVLFGRDGEKPKSPIRGWILLGFSLFILFPLGQDFATGQFGIVGKIFPDGSHLLWSNWVQVCYTWIMIFAWIDLFRVYFSKESKLMRYISDSSYWMYLVHMPLVFLGQHWVRQWDINAFIKFAVLNVLIFGILLTSYHLLVRSTFIGHFLNGRRYPFSKKKKALNQVHDSELEVKSQ
jgi:peptidoglycan/LPS O-acetylase OafA/YrhL